MTCAWFELLCRVPIAGLRQRLCRRHLERCARCREASDSGEALPPVLVAADRFPPGLDLWPGVKRGIEGLSGPSASPAVALPPPHRSWRWGYAAAATAMLLAAGLWIMSPGRRTVPQTAAAEDGSESRIRLCSAKIADQPAKVFQVQSRNPDRSIFWIAKENPRS